MNKRIFWISAVVVTALAMTFSAIAQPGGGQQRRGPGGPDGGQARGPGGPGGQGGGQFQRPGGGGQFGGGTDFFSLVRNPEFGKMLGVTEEQTTAIRKIFEDSQADRPQRARDAAPPTPDEMRQRMEEGRQRMDALLAKINKEVMKPEQVVKAQEVIFQAAGGLEARMLDARMLEILVLTDEQKAKIRQISEARMAEPRPDFDFRNASEEERDKFRADMEARAKKYNDQVKALLTADQKAKAEKLTAGAAEVREKLGVGQPRQDRPQGQERDRRQGPGGPGGYTPGSNAWQPGQDTPNSGSPQGQRSSRFRSETQNQ